MVALIANLTSPREEEQLHDGNALIFFFFITDGIVSVLFLFKAYYGLKFTLATCCSAPRMTEEI
eukprot:NODE_3485_length_769_cov_69.755556_g2913_i0.p3 GENE.NODE_3485_length_769_cov_69.755556_g2913_i0~~NODE_3485_length_769_cov_69.755556_g2913_i0.p3  ORF type:complete len:64 (-),score=25.08 NODE_3485_length_769_cov_69.755556_g2913_i0:414-605(-)